MRAAGHLGEPGGDVAGREAAGAHRLAHQRLRIGDVARDVNLTLAGVQAGDRGDAGWARREDIERQRLQRRHDVKRNARGQRQPLRHGQPTRRPVKLPGPLRRPSRRAPPARPAALNASSHRRNRWLSAARRSPRPRNTAPRRSRIATLAVATMCRGRKAVCRRSSGLSAVQEKAPDVVLQREDHQGHHDHQADVGGDLARGRTAPGA